MRTRPTLWVWLVAAGAAAAALGASRPALCQPSASTAAQHVSPPEAIQFFQSARERYREGRYSDAIADLERALVLDPTSPTLLYNLGRVYELTGQLAPALEHYRHYLELLPRSEAEERDRTQATVSRLEGAIASGAVQPAPSERPVEPLREIEGLMLVRERGVADEAFWVTFAGGAAALAGSAITGGLALDRAGARDALVLREAGQLAEYEAQYASLDADSRGLALATDVLVGVGGAALVTAVLLFVLRERQFTREIEPDESAGPAVAPFVVVSEQGTIVGMRGVL